MLNPTVVADDGDAACAVTVKPTSAGLFGIGHGQATTPAVPGATGDPRIVLRFALV